MRNRGRIDSARRMGLALAACACLAGCAGGGGGTNAGEPNAAVNGPAPQPSATPEGALQSLFLTAAAQPTSPPAATSTPQPVIARYQAFERGFLLQRGGETCVFAYTTASTSASPGGGIIIPAALAEQAGSLIRSCIPFETLNENPPVDPAPQGRVLPAGSFLQVWAAYPEVRQALGYATAEEYFHVAPLPPVAETEYAPVAALPDGRALYCGVQPATIGTCTLR